MLVLQVCGVTLGLLTALPTPTWRTLTEKAYGCPVEVVQSAAVRPDALRTLYERQRLPQGTWRVLPAARAQAAAAGDGVLLPGEPLSLLWRPGLRRELRAAQARGGHLLLDVPRSETLPALATTYAGLGLMPSGAYVHEAAVPAELGPGTYLLSELGGVPLLPRVIETRGRTLVPYLPGADVGERAGPQAPRSTLKVRPRLEWTLAGQHFSSEQTLSPGARLLGAVMPLAWGLGQLLTAAVPSLIFTASDTVAWLVLGLLVLTLLFAARAVVRR